MAEELPGKMCGRCYAETDELFEANCQEKPEEEHGPVGMYHCPDCGAMLLAGLPHPWLCKACLERRHPSFDMCSCHEGAVCTEACKQGKCHEGCNEQSVSGSGK